MSKKYEFWSSKILRNIQVSVWLPVFLRYRLQNPQNTVSDNLVSFPPPPSIRLAPPVLLWFVFSLDQTSSLKKTWLRACVIGRLLVKPYYCWLWRLVMSLVRFDPCILSQLNSRLLLVKLSVVKSITLNLLMKWPTRSYSAYLWKDLWVQTSHRRIVVGNHWFETLPGHEKRYPGNLKIHRKEYSSLVAMEKCSRITYTKSVWAV